MTASVRVLVSAACLALAACNGGGSPSASPSAKPAIATAKDTQPYSGIAADETVRFTGTEPFWGGQVANGALTYTTPENEVGDMVAVDRFAGRNGVSFSGELDNMPFVLAVTPGECSDGMSERSYPFTATLQVRGRQREGCAWTDKRPYTGGKKP